jgi:glycosyltransferase involved in cell wall biosynthesis
MAYLDRMMLRCGIRKSGAIVAQAEYQDTLLQSLYARKAEAVIPNFHPEESEPLVKANPMKVVWVANIKPKKQPEYFIELAQALSGCPQLEFIMVGRPDEGNYQKKIDAQLQQCGRVKYLGELPVDEVNALLREASIFVNTSEVEGFPNTFIQAWLRGVPVVSLQFDPDQVLVKESIGFCSGSLDQMKRDVLALARDDALRNEMGLRAQAYARAVHGLTQNVSRFIDLIEELRRPIRTDQ